VQVLPGFLQISPLTVQTNTKLGEIMPISDYSSLETGFGGMQVLPGFLQFRPIAVYTCTVIYKY
jgi:hypothetical protein